MTSTTMKKIRYTMILVGLFLAFNSFETVKVAAATTTVGTRNRQKVFTVSSTKSHPNAHRIAAESAVLRIQPFMVELIEMQSVTAETTRSTDANTTQESNLLPPPLSSVQTTRIRTVVEDLIRTYLLMQAPGLVVMYAALAQAVQKDVMAAAFEESSSNELNAIRTVYTLTFEGTIYVDVESSTAPIPTESQMLEMIITEAFTTSILFDKLLRTMPFLDTVQVVHLADISTSSPSSAPSSNGNVATTFQPSESPTQPPPNQSSTDLTSPPSTMTIPVPSGTTTLSPSSSPTVGTAFANPASNDISDDSESPSPVQHSTPIDLLGSTPAGSDAENEGRQQQQSNDSDKSTTTGGVYVGMVAGISALLIAMALLVVKARKQRETRIQSSSCVVSALDLTPDEELGDSETTEGAVPSVGQKTKAAISSSFSISSPGGRSQVETSSSPSAAVPKIANSPGGESPSFTISKSDPGGLSEHDDEIQSVSLSALKRISTFFHLSHKPNRMDGGGAKDIGRVAPELLQDDLSSIYASDDEAAHTPKFNDTFHGYISDFDDNLSIQKRVVVPLSSFQRGRHDYVVKKDMLEAQCFAGQMRDKSNQILDYSDPQQLCDDDGESREITVIPSHYFHQRAYTASHVKPQNEQFSGYQESSDLAEYEANDARLPGERTNQKNLVANRGGNPGSTKSMLPKLSGPWWNSRPASKTAINSGMRTPNDTTDLPCSPDSESDRENTTFRAASSEDWDPNDSQISSSMGTHDDVFVVRNGILGQNRDHSYPFTSEGDE